jgi:hypothetical protein
MIKQLATVNKNIVLLCVLGTSLRYYQENSCCKRTVLVTSPSAYAQKKKTIGMLPINLSTGKSSRHRVEIVNLRELRQHIFICFYFFLFHFFSFFFKDSEEIQIIFLKKILKYFSM